MSDEQEHDEMDRLLHQAFVSRPHGGGSPSLVDVRSRARRHQRRRVSGALGATAVLGVSGVAVLAARGGPESGIAGDGATSTWSRTEAGPQCGYTDFAPATTTVEDPTTTLVSTTDPSEAALTVFESGSIPLSPGCLPPGKVRCIGNNGTDDQGYTYFDYCEDLSINYPTTTTIIELVPPYTTVEDLPGQTTTSTTPVPTTTTELLATTTTS